jgi:hypothetical protein
LYEDPSNSQPEPTDNEPHSGSFYYTTTVSLVNAAEISTTVTTFIDGAYTLLPSKLTLSGSATVDSVVINNATGMDDEREEVVDKHSVELAVAAVLRDWKWGAWDAGDSDSDGD